jgi:methionine aminopeptidase
MDGKLSAQWEHTIVITEDGCWWHTSCITDEPAWYHIIIQ